MTVTLHGAITVRHSCTCVCTHLPSLHRYIRAMSARNTPLYRRRIERHYVPTACTLRMSRSTHARPHSRARNPLCVAHGLPGEILHLPLLRVHIYQSVQKRGNLFPPLPLLRDIARTRLENYRYYRKRIGDDYLCRNVRCGKRGKADRGHDKSLITSPRSDMYFLYLWELFPLQFFNRERVRDLLRAFTRKISD